MLAENIAAIESYLSGSGITFGIGKKALAVNDAPPRVVWDVLDAPLGPPDWSDNDYDAIYTRFQGLEAHLWGASLAQAETLFHNLIKACRTKIGGPGLVIGTAKWAEDANSQLGWVVVLPIQIKIPVLDKLLTMPPTPSDPATQPAANTQVTIVSGTPAASQANLIAATQNFDKP
jgi:hypothetical protein